MQTVRGRKGKGVDGSLSSTDSNMSQQGKIRVCIRVRPLNALERTQSGSNTCVNVQNKSTIQISTQQDNIHGSSRTSPTLAFDYAAGTDVTQEQFYQGTEVSSMIDASLEGFSSCIFAYGQTGSGKTHSMTGSANDPDQMGIMPRAFAYLYSRVKEQNDSLEGVQFIIRASYMELYNERIGDQLNPSNKDLLLRQRQKGTNSQFFVENQSIVQCHTIDDLMAVAIEGYNNRHTASHAQNAQSSRSHALLHVYIESRKIETLQNEKLVHWVRHGKLTFVDLAGSENQRTTGIAAAVHNGSEKPTANVKETASINRSLFSLGTVMNTLSAINTGKKPPNTFIPYRNSKLTMILQDCLGGSSLTMMFACISEAPSCADESKRTLTYASTCRNIKNKPQAELDPRTAMLMQYKEQCLELQEENNQLKSVLLKCGVSLDDLTSIMDGNFTINTNTNTNNTNTNNTNIYYPNHTNGCGMCSQSQQYQLQVLKENAKLRLRIQSIVQIFVNLKAQTNLPIPEDLLCIQQQQETNNAELMQLYTEDQAVYRNIWDIPTLSSISPVTSHHSSTSTPKNTATPIIQTNATAKNTTNSLTMTNFPPTEMSSTLHRRSSIDITQIPLDIQKSVSELQIRTNVLLKNNTELQQRVDMLQEQLMKNTNMKQGIEEDNGDLDLDLNAQTETEDVLVESYPQKYTLPNTSDVLSHINTSNNMESTPSNSIEPVITSNVTISRPTSKSVLRSTSKVQNTDLGEILTSRITDIVQKQESRAHSPTSSIRLSRLSLPSDTEDDDK